MCHLSPSRAASRVRRVFDDAPSRGDTPRGLHRKDQRRVRSSDRHGKVPTPVKGRSGETVNRKRAPAAHGKNGPGGDLPQAADHQSGDQRSGLPLLALRWGVRPASTRS